MRARHWSFRFKIRLRSNLLVSEIKDREHTFDTMYSGRRRGKREFSCSTVALRTGNRRSAAQSLRSSGFGLKFSGLFTVHFFCSVQMVMVSKNHGYKWVAVMVFTLSRLERGWFRRNSVCCGPVYGPWLSLRFGYGPVYDSRLSLRVGFGPVYTQHISFFPNYDISHAFDFRYAMHSPLRTNSSIFLHPPSPQQPPLVPIVHTGGIGCVFLAAQQ